MAEAPMGTICMQLFAGSVENGVGERLDVPWAVVADAVDEESRGPVYAAADSALEIFADARGEFVGLQVLFELGCIQSDRGGIFDEVRVVEAVLVLEKIVVHLPELALRACGLGGFGGVLGVGVHG